MNPSEKWNDLEKYVYSEHKASCMLEAGGYACTCGKQEAAAYLARITAENNTLKFLLLRCQRMNYTADGEDAALWNINGEFEQYIAAALKSS